MPDMEVGSLLCFPGILRATRGVCYTLGVAIRGGPIRVPRIVVVDVAGRVHIPRVRRVATIRRAQAHILRPLYSLHPYISSILHTASCLISSRRV